MPVLFKNINVSGDFGIGVYKVHEQRLTTAELKGKRGGRAVPVCKSSNTYLATAIIGIKELEYHIGVAVVFNKF